MDVGHGRLDERTVRVFAVEPLDIGLPHVRSLAVVEKSSSRTNGEAQEPVRTLSYYVGSHHPRPAEFFADLIRGHWGGCEIRNHWVRDALFGEDATRSRNLNLNGNLAVLRCAVIALKAQLAPERSWPLIHELCALKPSTAYNLVCNNSFK